MSMIELDADHVFLKKVREHFHAKSKSYHLETPEEVELAKIFVKRGFLYYALNQEHVAPFDHRAL